MGTADLCQHTYTHTRLPYVSTPAQSLLWSAALCRQLVLKQWVAVSSTHIKFYSEKSVVLLHLLLGANQISWLFIKVILTFYHSIERVGYLKHWAAGVVSLTDANCSL